MKIKSLLLLTVLVCLSPLSYAETLCNIEVSIHEVSSSSSNQKTPIHLTIDPLITNSFDPIQLDVGQELIVEILNPENTLNSKNTFFNLNYITEKCGFNKFLNQEGLYGDKFSIYCNSYVNEYGSYWNYFRGISPLKTVNHTLVNPISFQYKAIAKGSLNLIFIRGPISVSPEK
jgi:hypothetical protein